MPMEKQKGSVSMLHLKQGDTFLNDWSSFGQKFQIDQYAQLAVSRARI